MTKRGRGSAIAVLLLALAAGGCGGEAAPTVSEARATARTFYTAIVREDWPTAYALLAPEVQARLDADAFAALGKQYRTGFGFEPANVEVRSCDEQGDQATAHVVVTGNSASKKNHYRETATLRKGPTGWKVVPPEAFGRVRR
jgi:hypothetical protein